jgi:hypothetical protein
MSNKGGRLKRRLEGLSSPPIPVRKSRIPKLVLGDRVKVRETPESTGAGLAGLTGEIIGFTKKSGVSVTAIGAGLDDFAYNVSFTDAASTAWFAEQQLEVVDHAPGSAVAKEGAADTGDKKPAWKFW